MSVDTKIVPEEYVSLIIDSDVITQYLNLHSVRSINRILPASFEFF